MPAPAHLKALSKAVKAHLGCRCKHAHTDQAVLGCGPRKDSERDVETFTLLGHPRAVEAYAWTCSETQEPIHHIVLKVLPIWDASDAVGSVAEACGEGSRP
jgi:hypothetical protein